MSVVLLTFDSEASFSASIQGSENGNVQSPKICPRFGIVSCGIQVQISVEPVCPQVAVRNSIEGSRSETGRAAIAAAARTRSGFITMLKKLARSRVTTSHER